MNVDKKNFIIICEFDRSSGSSTGELASDLFELISQQGEQVVFFHSGKRYFPGGTNLKRIFTLLKMHLLLPWVLFKLFLFKFFKNRREVVVISITTPPFIHWNAALFSKVFGFQSICWYFDAHPGIEEKIIKNSLFSFLIPMFLVLDRLFLSFFNHIITLDNAMKSFLEKRMKRGIAVNVVHPWSTYISPPSALKQPDGSKEVRILYAGNYNVSHDLSELVSLILSHPQVQTRLEFVFVGMNSFSQGKIKDIFASLVCKIEYLPRFDRFSELLTFMKDFDFGLVSLHSSNTGLMCPSKAFTYLSQGLPILYNGGPNTLSSELCSQGWGLTIQQLLEYLVSNKELSLNFPQNIFPNPQSFEKEKILRILEIKK